MRERILLRDVCAEPVGYRKELWFTSAAIAVCVSCLFLVYRDLTIGFAEQAQNVVARVETILCSIFLSLLVYGALVYLFARIGFILRNARLTTPSKDELESVYVSADGASSVCILIPSYKEEIHVLAQTTISAALAEYPARRVVVLIDDPPARRGADPTSLVAARNLVQDLNDRFQRAATQLRAELSDFLVRRGGAAGCNLEREAQHLADLYDGVADWLEELGSEYSKNSIAAFAHTDKFFLETIILAPATAHRSRASELRESPPILALVEREYHRLAALLHVPIVSFERKQYANLSHAANKAMNLNSYISLVGKSFKFVQKSGLLHLQECGSDVADLSVPHADYLLTLDADSFVLPDYILKLTPIMDNDPRIAVAQTPYSAIPGAPNRLERAAGAQTDLQYIVHQGLTFFGATYWVGANALLRYAALREIRSWIHEGGQPIEVFIQERTVIEDTGSTIDLVRQGWTLHNHPERLAYSATPPDFGSLIIQRRRWANGGLIIFADLIRYALSFRSAPPRFSELFMRTHYLCSPALATFVVPLLVLVPLTNPLSCVWLLCTALPYYLIYLRDLRLCGYSWGDATRVYALGLMLVPVSGAGVLRSVQQMVTGQKTAFSRTPKVHNRTGIPPLHVALQIGLLAIIAGGAAINILQQRYAGVLCCLNAVVLFYGFVVLIGWDQAYEDLFCAYNGRRDRKESVLAFDEANKYDENRLVAPAADTA